MSVASITEFPVLTFLVFLPLLGALILCLPTFARRNGPPDETEHDEHALPSFFDKDGAGRLVALWVSVFTFAVSLVIAAGFNASNGSYQYVESLPWIKSFGITYTLGIDGISLSLILLTTLLVPLVVLVSPSVKNWSRGYLISMLILETAMIGTLCALDLVVFYVFWEMMLAPMFFIIGIWGGKRRIYATIKFVLYTALGSVLMLVAIIYTAWQYQLQTGEYTFLIPELVRYSHLSFRQEMWLFLACALAFGIKVPVFPFHTWLPDAHVEAPTGGSVILAGVLLKMGVYGFLRIAWPIFPRAAIALAPWIAVLAVIGIIYGALVAWAQTDIKKLVAYSSVSHLGFCMLGLAAFSTLATSGAVYQLLNHGISTGALFLLVGVIYERRHTREISEFGGLASRMPIFAFLFLIFTLSSIALPLTNGFVGEFMILLGSYKVFPTMTVLSTSAVILGAVYMLTLYLKTMFGELNVEKNGSLPDVNTREILAFAPLLVLVFVMGVYPKLFMKVIEPSVNEIISTVNSKAAVSRQEDTLDDDESLQAPGGGDNNSLGA